jgi:hypothetical protein
MPKETREFAELVVFVTYFKILGGLERLTEKNGHASITETTEQDLLSKRPIADTILRIFLRNCRTSLMADVFRLTDLVKV